MGLTTDAGHAEDPPSGDTGSTIRHHRRFALTEVTLNAVSVGGATVDMWQDAARSACWSVRVLMQPLDVSPDADLAGRTRDGRILRGRVSLIGPGPALRGRGGPVLMEWRGVGELRLDAQGGDG